MIGLDTARQLLDFRGPNRAITDEAAEEQLRGAVALHNILETERVGYLADEVGMGKTYVALGALALFRHFDPGFRVLVIAPRENIQVKWMKELRNFVRNNVRFADLRVKAVHGASARPLVACHNLAELVRETSLNPDRDFFARLTSFSLPLGKDTAAWRKRRDELLTHLPWANREAFDLRSREEFKDNFARAVCAAIPPFDLVIVDEGHNLKHGFGQNVSARNRILGLAFGHPSERPRGFPGYGPRARRVLFLSATPLENDYVQLWNQLDVFGLGGAAPVLASKTASEEEKREVAQRFLIRRVTAMELGGRRLTKNLYRREWRQGGIDSHDDPLEVSSTDRDRQRLIVALVQKKVSEVLGHERFNNSFQIGMLASFESFLETAKVKKAGEDDEDATFDDADQTDDLDERMGVDVGAVNSLARSYRNRFKREMPHPKMDALVEHLAAGLPEGRKALVFVRRVASVKELQAKLEERYDDWLMGRLREDLPSDLVGPLEKRFEDYRAERIARRQRRLAATAGNSGELEEEGQPPLASTVERDEGGLDSFFAWFFRGNGPDGVLSGAALQRRFNQPTSAYSTLFEDNYAAWLLDARPGDVLRTLAGYLGRPVDAVREDLFARAAPLLPAGGRERRIGRLHLFAALQIAALGLMAEAAGALQERARIVLRAVQNGSGGVKGRATVPAEAQRWLEEETFFSALRARPELRARIWPEPAGDDFRAAFREQELRRQFLAATARLGHAFVDLWVLVVRQLGSLKSGTRQDDETAIQDLLTAYLDELDRQRTGGDCGFRAFRELSLGADHFHLILSVNVPDLWTLPLGDAGRTLGTLLGSQQPIAGMYGAINKTLVRQFRLPGYPFVLVTTELLQEGEDLHTFCSAVYHYGISWMPSAMEQRTGRIDRVNSDTERRLKRLAGALGGDDKLQVYLPHLRDTVEVLQVERVLERMNRFVRLMHQDLTQPDGERRQIDVAQEMLRTHRDIRPIEGELKTAFPIREELLAAPSRALAVPPESTAPLLERFRRLRSVPLGDLRIAWEANSPDDALIGTVRLRARQQPFTLLIRSFGGRLMLRCVSWIGRVLVADLDLSDFASAALDLPAQVSAVYDEKMHSYSLSAEAEVLLADEAHDASRAAWLLESVTTAADRLEQVLEPGTDKPLTDSRGELEGESDRGD